MHTDVNKLFKSLWNDYIEMTPSAAKVHQLLSKGEAIINDHIALRTFNIDKVNLTVLAAHFESLGYVDSGDYNFEAKKLKAKHFEHPDPTQPKVFISELMVEAFSPQLQGIIKGLVEQIDIEATTADKIGRAHV